MNGQMLWPRVGWCLGWLAGFGGLVVLGGLLEPPADSEHVPWLEEVQPTTTVPGQSPQELRGTKQLSDLLVDPTGKRIENLSQWCVRRQEVRKWWSDFLGLPTLDHARPIRTLKVLQKEEVGDVARYLVSYETEPDWPTQAYLLFPRDHNPLDPPAAKRLPGVVVFHSTTQDTIRQPAGLTAETTKAFGLQVAQQGMVALCPRCFLWKDSPPTDYPAQVVRFQKRHPGAKGMAKMLADCVAAVDVLASLPGVDAERLGAVGHSLGAKEVLYLAAFDERIRATVSSEGGIGLMFSNWDAPWYLGQEIRTEQFGHDHHELLALVAPRAFLLIGGNSADGDPSWPYIKAAWNVYRFYTPRPAFGLWNHRQGHSVPAEAQKRILQWLQTYLQSGATSSGK